MHALLERRYGVQCHLPINLTAVVDCVNDLLKIEGFMIVNIFLLIDFIHANWSLLTCNIFSSQ